MWPRLPSRRRALRRVEVVRVAVADGLLPRVEVVELQHLPVELEIGLLLLQVEQEQDGFP